MTEAMPAERASLAEDFTATFGSLTEIGRDPAGGYHRLAWTDADRAAREWFTDQAASRDMSYERDRAGNLWAWWGDPDAGEALVLGSHLDTVPCGGAYDGALGVVGGFVAVSAARRRGVEARRPVAVAAFAEEEGGRFGVATLGSRLLAGTLDPAEVLDLRDDAGTTLADALRADGLPPGDLGADKELLARIGALVELHIEQGRALTELASPLAIGTGIWPHGRWRLHLTGKANHAGTTRLADRHDPMLVLARAVLGARERATQLGAVATVGRVVVAPGGVNIVPGAVDAWLDARAPSEVTLDELVESVWMEVRLAGARHGVAADLSCESRSPEVEFDVELRARLKEVLRGRDLAAPELPTAAGHDAGSLAAVLPTAMLFVRNPTGVSHSPEEFAADADCVVGCEVLADLIAGWVGQQAPDQ